MRVSHFMFVWNSIFDINFNFNFIIPKNEDLKCLKKYENLMKYLKFWTRILLRGIFVQSGFLLFCKAYGSTLESNSYSDFCSKVTEKFTFKFLIFTFENFEFSINHISIHCMIPETSYHELLPNLVIYKKSLKIVWYCSRK